MRKVVYDDGTFQFPLGVVKGESGNHLPTPFTIISSDEFWHRWGTYHPEFEDFIQARLGDGLYRNVHIFWYHDCGLAIAPPVKWYIKEGKVAYHDDPIFIYIGCEHKFKPMSDEQRKERGIVLFNCDHAEICELCGTPHCYNSGD